MKNLLVLYNVIFLFAGNVLFSNIHYFHHHSHDHNHLHDSTTSECYECIVFEYGNDYIDDFNELNFSNNNFDQFIFQYSSKIRLEIDEVYSSRAPPIA